MPAKNSKLQVGKRKNIINKDLWKKFVLETNIEIPYLDFVKVITLSNEKIKDKILNNVIGFKNPEGLGYFTITRFKSNKRAIDFKKSKELKTTVYHTNFHSFGYSNRVQWLTSNMTDVKFINIYKFIPERNLSRGIARKIIDEKKVYNEQTYDFFKGRTLKLNIDKLQKLANGNKSTSTF